MRTYTIYTKKDPEGNILEMQYIPEKFAIWGFIFGILWLIYHRLWKETALYAIIAIVMHQLTMALVITSFISTLIYLSLSLFIGFSGRDFIRQKLESDGFEFYDVILASSEMEAELRYLTAYTINPKQHV